MHCSLLKPEVKGRVSTKPVLLANLQTVCRIYNGTRVMRVHARARVCVHCMYMYVRKSEVPRKRTSTKFRLAKGRCKVFPFERDKGMDLGRERAMGNEKR